MLEDVADLAGVNVLGDELWLRVTREVAAERSLEIGVLQDDERGVFGAQGVVRTGAAGRGRGVRWSRLLIRAAGSRPAERDRQAQQQYPLHTATCLSAATGFRARNGVFYHRWLPPA